MEGSIGQSYCNVCCEILNSSDNPTRASDILEILKSFVNTNLELLQDAIICEACVSKIQSAYKFKILHSGTENIALKEETNSDQVMCEICKKNVDPSDSIPFSDVTLNKLILTKHLSLDFESKLPTNIQTCEKCHKSLLNLCTITNSISIFEQNDTMENTEDTNSSNWTENFKIDIKEEDKDWPLQNAEENYVDCTFQGVKTEDEAFQEFLLKNEEVDIKSDHDLEDERKWKHEAQKLSFLNQDLNNPKTSKFETKTTNLCNEKSEETRAIYQCQSCEFQSKYKSSIRQHMVLHKSLDEIKMFECQICGYQFKRKGALTQHMKVHKNPDELEMFQCNVCNHQSKRKSSLNKHMLIHKSTNEVEMFPCPICDYQTKQKVNLKRHMVIHKKNNEIEMFQCEICKFQTKHKNCHKRHMLIHKRAEKLKYSSVPTAHIKEIAKAT